MPGHSDNTGSGRPWYTYVLGALCVAAIAGAYVSVGAASSSSGTPLRTAVAREGIVQSTVSGSGTVEPASELNLGFKTAGTVTRIYTASGQTVRAGELLAELDPKNAEVALEQARASLQAAEATLAQEQESGGESSRGAGGGSTGTAGAATTASAGGAGPPASVSATRKAGAPAAAAGGQGGVPTRAGKRPRPTVQSTTTTTSTTQAPRESLATREANLASAQAAVRSGRLAVEDDEQALSNTKLYAPQSGTIVSLSGEVGETVSASATSRAQAASSTGSAGSSSASAGGRSAAGSGAASSGGSGTGSAGTSSSGSASAFAVLSDLSSMQVVVALSESEIGSVRVGQTATVTVEALAGAKLAATVTEVAILPVSSSSGVVSYDVTFALDQTEAGLKPGMSATAEVVVKQATGVSVPSSAITAGSVTVVHSGKEVRRAVSTGLAGATSTVILSGLAAGEEVVLPTIAGGSTSGAAGGALSRLRGLGGGALGGGGGLGAGGGLGGRGFGGAGLGAGRAGG
ncbi:MAG: efflux RND transporter periplasmic adaptor subunit [Solirubrobacteraceae bacterium]